MIDYIQYDFDAEIAVMCGKKSDYYFIDVPRDVSKHIYYFTDHIQRGFSSLKVKAHIGKSAWVSSIFPTADEDTYFLLLNKKICTAEKLEEGNTADICLHVFME